jgi:protein-S-isoprenylcysteine O-methyltransferase Ste14
MPRGPRILFPPPLVFVLAWLAGLWLDHQVPVRIAGSAGGVMAVLPPAVTFAGLALTFGTLLILLRARTGILPFKPTRALITDGPFRYSRNPVYLGLLIAYLGVTAWTGLLWPLATLPLGLWFLWKTAIQPEETYLAARFGEEYAAYCRRVRRWI